jgi:hypothetical protein
MNMNHRLLLALALCGVTGTASLSADAPAAAPGVVKKVESHYRIFKLSERISYQRSRISGGVADKTLSDAQAKAARAVLDNVTAAIKADAKAKGAKAIMSKGEYDGYSNSLDENSATIAEEKQYFYYYGPYADWSHDYLYYDDPYAAQSAPAPAVSEMEKDHPRIFELKDRIKNQHARIDQGLKDSTLTKEQASDGNDRLASVEKQINQDYKANGSKVMSKAKYDSYNATLDENSTILREQRRFYYYYGPYVNQYTYWD